MSTTVISSPPPQTAGIGVSLSNRQDGANSVSGGTDAKAGGQANGASNGAPAPVTETPAVLIDVTPGAGLSSKASPNGTSDLDTGLSPSLAAQVKPDLDKDGAALVALDLKQQLAAQPLSLTNSGATKILDLFR